MGRRTKVHSVGQLSQCKIYLSSKGYVGRKKQNLEKFTK